MPNSEWVVVHARQTATGKIFLDAIGPFISRDRARTYMTRCIVEQGDSGNSFKLAPLTRPSPNRRWARGIAG